MNDNAQHVSDQRDDTQRDDAQADDANADDLHPPDFQPDAEIASFSSDYTSAMRLLPQPLAAAAARVAGATAPATTVPNPMEDLPDLAVDDFQVASPCPEFGFLFDDEREYLQLLDEPDEPISDPTLDSHLQLATSLPVLTSVETGLAASDNQQAFSTIADLPATTLPITGDGAQRVDVIAHIPTPISEELYAASLNAAVCANDDAGAMANDLEAATARANLHESVAATPMQTFTPPVLVATSAPPAPAPAQPVLAPAPHASTPTPAPRPQPPRAPPPSSEPLARATTLESALMAAQAAAKVESKGQPTLLFKTPSSRRSRLSASASKRPRPARNSSTPKTNAIKIAPRSDRAASTSVPTPQVTTATSTEVEIQPLAPKAVHTTHSTQTRINRSPGLQAPLPLTRNPETHSSSSQPSHFDTPGTLISQPAQPPTVAPTAQTHAQIPLGIPTPHGNMIPVLPNMYPMPASLLPSSHSSVPPTDNPPDQIHQHTRIASVHTDVDRQRLAQTMKAASTTLEADTSAHTPPSALMQAALPQISPASAAAGIPMATLTGTPTPPPQQFYHQPGMVIPPSMLYDPAMMHFYRMAHPFGYPPVMTPVPGSAPSSIAAGLPQGQPPSMNLLPSVGIVVPPAVAKREDMVCPTDASCGRASDLQAAHTSSRNVTNADGTQIQLPKQPPARLDRHPVLGRLQLTDGQKAPIVNSLPRKDVADMQAVGRDSLKKCTSNATMSSARQCSGENTCDPKTRLEDSFKRQPGADIRTSKKRLVWTPDLHERFVRAFETVGLENAVPKTLVTIMNVEGLTTEHVKSHLQKYRNSLKKEEDEEQACANGHGDTAALSEMDVRGNVGLLRTDLEKASKEVFQEAMGSTSVDRRKKKVSCENGGIMSGSKDVGADGSEVKNVRSAKEKLATAEQTQKDLELEMVKEKTLEMQLRIQKIVHRTVALERRLQQGHETAVSKTGQEDGTKSAEGRTSDVEPASVSRQCDGVAPDTGVLNNGVKRKSVESGSDGGAMNNDEGERLSVDGASSGKRRRTEDDRTCELEVLKTEQRQVQRQMSEVLQLHEYLARRNQGDGDAEQSAPVDSGRDGGGGGDVGDGGKGGEEEGKGSR